MNIGPADLDNYWSNISLIDGEVVSEGKPVLHGEYFQLAIGIKQTGCDEITVENPLIAGEGHMLL